VGEVGAGACDRIPPPPFPRVQASVSAIPKFCVRGRLNRTVCSLSSPFTGEITVEHSDAPIRSLELQLVRVETISECAHRGEGGQGGGGAVCR
jgi:hypothetical protein